MEIRMQGFSEGAVNVASDSRAQSAVSRASRSLSAAESPEALREAAVAFESLFMQQLFESMRRTVPKSDLLESSFARDTYEGMFYEELAKTTAQAGGIGLAKMLMEQLGQHVYDPK